MALDDKTVEDLTEMAVRLEGRVSALETVFRWTLVKILIEDKEFFEDFFVSLREDIEDLRALKVPSDHEDPLLPVSTAVISKAKALEDLETFLRNNFSEGGGNIPPFRVIPGGKHD